MFTLFKIGLVLCLSVVAFTGCRKGSAGPVISVGEEMGIASNQSELTAVNISLPSREGLKADVPEIESLMNGWHLVVRPTGDVCTSPSNLDVIKEYIKDAKLEVKLNQGCDYALKLELGQRMADGETDSDQKLAKVFYVNNSDLIIKKSDIQGKAEFQAAVKLQLQDAGRAIGLGSH